MEQQILEDFVKGEELALQKIIDEYSSKLSRYCYTILLDYHNTQDAVQETFLKAYQKRHQFDVNTSISAWLYRIAYTTSLNILKKNKRISYLKFGVKPQTCYIHEPLRSALLKLTDCDRALLYGRAVEEQSYEDLEKILSVRASALRKRFERMRKKLMHQLGPSYPQYMNSRLEEYNEKI